MICLSGIRLSYAASLSLKALTRALFAKWAPNAKAVMAIYGDSAVQYIVCEAVYHAMDLVAQSSNEGRICALGHKTLEAPVSPRDKNMQ